MPTRITALLPCAIFLSTCASMQAMPAAPTPAPLPDTGSPMVIAHRGASALLPEHTLAAYARAIEDGADAIEPDLVSTKDGVLVSRHENEIGATTDVGERPEFADRRTRKRIDGKWVEGWFTEDFTLAELKTLRARERLPALRSTAHDGLYEIPTLDEIIALAAEESEKRGRPVALVPEIKHPAYFASIGLAMEEPLLATLAAHPYSQSAPILIQSFETGNLRALRERIGRGGNIRLLQLFEYPHLRPYDLVASGRPQRYAAMMTPAGLRDVATYADAIGPRFQSLSLRKAPDGRHRSRLVEDAHAAGLQVMPYTFRPENVFLPRGYRDGADDARHDAGSIRHLRDYLEAGIDGFFTDDPALGREAVDRR